MGLRLGVGGWSSAVVGLCLPAFTKHDKHMIVSESKKAVLTSFYTFLHLILVCLLSLFFFKLVHLLWTQGIVLLSDVAII